MARRRGGGTGNKISELGLGLSSGGGDEPPSLHSPNGASAAEPEKTEPAPPAEKPAPEMPDDPFAGEEVVSAAVGSEIAELEQQVPEPAPDPAPARPTARPRRRRKQEELTGVELYLPDDLLFRARSMGRPRRTGAERSLGAAFLLSAYVRAVDELLDGELEMHGISKDPGAQQELTERIKTALLDAAR